MVTIGFKSQRVRALGRGLVVFCSVLLLSACGVTQSVGNGTAAMAEAVFYKKVKVLEKLKEKQYLPGIDGGDGFYIAKFRRDV